MTSIARRQASTTSLSQYANYGRAPSPLMTANSLDFCNAFWGIADGGVDVLFARLRGATRTVDELKGFWKERAAIEEDYARRLAKLAKMSFGRDEIGEMRNCIDAVRLETDRQASSHQTLATQLRNEMELPTATFYARQAHHKKTVQSQIEKEFKSKQTQESYVAKSREKYEHDCMKINAFTAQSSLVQGRDLDKIHLKLEKAQQTVHSNERDFANFSRALSESVVKWENDWKAFCDSAQDMEEERLEFMRDVMWSYANSISTVCVADDESCEKMRLALEQMTYDAEMENFVRDYGTGSEMPDPPAFVNYTAPDAIPSSRERPTSRPAQFMRNSQREREKPPPPSQQQEPPREESPPRNMVGVGAIGKKTSQPDLQQLSRRSTRASVAIRNEDATPPSGRPTSSTSYRAVAANSDPTAEPIKPNAETYIKVGSKAYKVDLSKDPQQQQQSHMSVASTKSGMDPLAKQMEDLRRSATSAGGTLRKGSSSVVSSSPATDIAPGSSSSTKLQSPYSASSRPPSTSTSPAPPSQTLTQKDYRNSADLVVGSLPVAHQSRPSSPNSAVPTAAFMQPPRQGASPAHDTIDSTLVGYGQHFPGEQRGRSPSRGGGHSPSPSYNGGGHRSQASLSQPSADPERVGRRPSIGHAGVGAHGSRSPSPAPPGPPQQQQQQQQMRPPSAYGNGGASRSTSPNNVGIALDSSGRVMVDEMANRYQQQQQQQPQQTPYAVNGNRPPSQMGHSPSPYQHPPPAQQQQPPPQQQQQGTMARRQSYIPQQSQGFVQAPAPAPQQPPPPPIQQVQQQQQQQPTSYGHGQQASYSSGYSQVPPPVVQPVQAQPPYQAPPPPQPQPSPYQAPPPPQPQPSPYQQVAPPAQGNGYYAASPQQQQQQQQSYQPQQQQQQLSYPANAAAASYNGRVSPQPPPPQPQAVVQNGGLTGQATTEDGSRILFYVKALYDYTATIEEEFDFQTGDVIAVTATPEDGWWSGELLDERRRVKGRYVFPSNFVCLF